MNPFTETQQLLTLFPPEPARPSQTDDDPLISFSRDPVYANWYIQWFQAEVQTNEKSGNTRRWHETDRRELGDPLLDEENLQATEEQVKKTGETFRFAPHARTEKNGRSTQLTIALAYNPATQTYTQTTFLRWTHPHDIEGTPRVIADREIIRYRYTGSGTRQVLHHQIQTTTNPRNALDPNEPIDRLALETPTYECTREYLKEDSHRTQLAITYTEKKPNTQYLLAFHPKIPLASADLYAQNLRVDTVSSTAQYRHLQAQNGPKLFQTHIQKSFQMGYQEGTSPEITSEIIYNSHQDKIHSCRYRSSDLRKTWGVGVALGGILSTMGMAIVSTVLSPTTAPSFHLSAPALGAILATPIAWSLLFSGGLVSYYRLKDGAFPLPQPQSSLPRNMPIDQPNTEPPKASVPLIAAVPLTPYRTTLQDENDSQHAKPEPPPSDPMTSPKTRFPERLRDLRSSSKSVSTEKSPIKPSSSSNS